MQFYLKKACLPQLLVLLLGLTFTCAVAHGQARLNLGFEPDVNRPNPLLFWTWSKNPAVRVALDTTTAARQGRGSVRFELTADDPVSGVAFMSSALSPDSVRGNLTVRAWLRPAGFQGKAGLYASVHEAANPTEALVRVDSIRRRPVDSEWQLLEMQLPVPAAATKLLLGFQAQGTGLVRLVVPYVRWLHPRLVAASKAPMLNVKLAATGSTASAICAVRLLKQGRESGKASKSSAQYSQ